MIFNKKKEEKKSPTLRDLFGDVEGQILINYSKFNQEIKKCREEKENKQCRAELKKIGVEFLDDE